MAEETAEGGPETWEFAGWGRAERISDLPGGTAGPERPTHLLGQWSSTAICGNDITSSCLYVSALCAAQAGQWAPVVLAIVAGVLFLFRGVYAEVGSALPLNGGTYTVLLNTTNKRLAAAAACLTLLSYVATAVISAGEAMHYAHNLYHELPILWATVGLLGFFAFLNLIGITESAVVALGIFVFHILTLTALCGTAIYAIANDASLLRANWSAPLVDVAGDPIGLGHALFFGFAAAMLGISGFESSANFIEEQREGVFPKTLRNMWVAVAIFNPLIATLVLGILPLDVIRPGPEDLLAMMGERSAGHWLRTWVSVDAVLVLSGAVLTSYVGVIGLMRRMSLDRCLPQWFLAQNRLTRTNHWIILAFFLVCCSILWFTGGAVGLLAGVYTLSFLSVMALFAVGNMLLKVKREKLPRASRASWPAVTFAFVAVLVGLAGNVLMDPHNVQVFAGYFVVTLAAVMVMFLRIQLLRVVLFVSSSIVEKITRINQRIRALVSREIEAINSMTVVYFAKGDDPAELNRAALYVLTNEQTTHLKVVHVYEDESEIPRQLGERLALIDRLYPQLRIDFLAVQGEFTPGLIESLSARLGVPKNYMFLGTPGDRFPHRIEHLGGVRLIL